MIIMIADDEPMVRAGLKNMIQELYPDENTVLEAKNGFELMESVRQHRPHLAFVDVSMPLADGLSAIESLSGECDVKWVILSGAANFDYARKAIRLGVYEYILKPISLAELRDIIERVKTGLRAESAAAGPKDLITRIEEYIEANYAGNIGMNSISQIFGLTPNYLSKIFHEGTGTRFMDYITEKRITEAKRLLSQNACVTVREVAKRVGYQSSRHFTKVFLKYSGGVYPSDYQKQKVQ